MDRRVRVVMDRRVRGVVDRRVRIVMAYKLVRHVPNITPIGCHGSSCSWCHGLQARQTCPQYNTYRMSWIVVFVVSWPTSSSDMSPI